ncbi:zinc finger protein 845-like isoform X1 [Athalia rosae]|uniref:zinc finger protein 845-like isoform X1 n=2 Tax=Athalia rosae TaxID=37344 RepID=UPI002033D930|nr:zinc finger protein 845-like isoform X1 [Athalia rosae]
MVKLSDFSKSCRLCSRVYRVEKLVKVFSNRGISLRLKDSVNAHLPIKVIETDTMPRNICINCIRRLNTTNEFFDTVLAADKLFKRLLKKKEQEYVDQLDKKQQSKHYFQNEKTEAHTRLSQSQVKSLENTDNRMASLVNDHVGVSKVLAESKLDSNRTKIEIPADKNANEGKYLSAISKSNHVVLGAGNCKGNIVIKVTNNAAYTPKDQCTKLPIEVLCCPDCKETAKIFSTEERQLFFEYLKQHCCNQTVDTGEVVKSFVKYKEIFGSGVIVDPKLKALETNDPPKLTSSRVWPEGDLPADPGPSPTTHENIFEDEVRLDDDFHWPMPKRIRKLHACTVCDFMAKSAMGLKAHKKMHRTDKKQISQAVKCQHCNEKFETITEVRKHQRLAHVTFGAKNSLCEYCGVLKAQKALRDHVLKQHTVESEIEKQECDVCGKSFISPTSLYLHKKIHTLGEKHLCDLCGKSFKQRIALRRHYMLHFPRAPPKFKCNICEKRVTTRGSLRLHMMRHTGEKPQECPECHLVMRHGLKHHMRLHSDEAPFKCVVCSADFKRRDYVRRHMRKHLNETTELQTLQCTICDHQFDDIKDFLIHHRDIHGNEIFTQIKIYECKTCSMQFADALQHKDHEDTCKTVEWEPLKSHNTEPQSCIMVSGAKVDDVRDHRNCPRSSGLDGSDLCSHCHDKEPSQNSLVVHRRSEPSRQSFINALDDQRFPSQIERIAYHQNRYKFNDSDRLKRTDEGNPQLHPSVHVILPEEVMCLGANPSEYSYNIEKPSLRVKGIPLMVDEQITNNSIAVFESPVEEFSQTSHSQSQLRMHQSTDGYVRDSLTWKQH